MAQKPPNPLGSALHWGALLSDLAACLRFYSRLPIPVQAFETDPHAMPDFSKLARVLPVAGAMLGALGALALGLCLLVGLPAQIAAVVGLTALVASSGAMHEDGLADCADGFGGGTTLARKLEIMKDSRLGTYGTCALVLTLLLRASALGLLVSHGFWGAALVMIATAGVSRTLGLLPLVLLPPARTQGAGFAAGCPSTAALQVAVGLAVAVGLLPLLAGVPLRALLTAGVWALGLTYGMVRLARAQIGGQTGDVAGAVQQVAEVGFLLGVVATSGWLN